ncbi:MAG TPA: hypothetical protein K8V15_06795 [Tessaracoccus flavescens]|uniref:Uncharacterized protein n=1 Tax=Tessaracoccus flavescens TaxID=399497 RepID=A0A921EQS8_9ACTN|nr:hypothetical protein [Tessaracoccus flavescens]
MVLFISALLWLIGSLYQAVTALIEMRAEQSRDLKGETDAAFAQVRAALEERQESAARFAEEQGFERSLVGINYTDIYALSEALGKSLQEQRTRSVRRLGVTAGGWGLIFFAALLGVLGSWPC